MRAFQKIDNYIENVTIRKHGVPCCDIIVMRDHEQLYRYTTGVSDAKANIPLKPGTLFNMYSCTKPMTATAGMRLIEEGKLALDTPVSKFLPAFSDLHLIRDGKKVCPDTKLVVRHLFTMCGGFDYALAKDPHTAALLDHCPDAGTLQIVNTFAQRPLHFTPGKRFQYSVCHDILAAVIEVVSGMPFREYMDKLIFTPLGMKDSKLHATAEDLNRMADQYLCEDGRIIPISKGNELVLTENYDSGGAGLISTADDYAIFADTMACGGTAKNGYQLLKPETIHLLATPQVDMHLQDAAALSLARPDYSYGLGVRTRVKTVPGSSAVGEFGWDGAAGAYVLMDPVNHISIFFAMHVRNWPACISDDHLVLRDLIYEAII